MAKTIKCDACGVIALPDETFVLQVTRQHRSNNLIIWPTDLCKDCTNALETFLKQIAARIGDCNAT